MATAISDSFASILEQHSHKPVKLVDDVLCQLVQVNKVAPTMVTEQKITEFLE